MLKNSKILKKFFIINLPATMSGIQLKVFHFTSLRLQIVSTLKFKMLPRTVVGTIQIE